MPTTAAPWWAVYRDPDMPTKKRSTTVTQRARSKQAPAAGVPELNRDEIVVAACRLINRVGVNKFTMRALAEELNVSTMAAYRHVTGKNELLRMAVDSVLAQVVLPDPTLPWTSRFDQLAHGVWNAIEDHRWIPGYALSQPSSFPQLDRILDELHAILTSAGFDENEAGLAMAMAWTFTAGLLSWADEPTPYLEFGIDVMLSGFMSRTPKRRR